MVRKTLYIRLFLQNTTSQADLLLNMNIIIDALETGTFLPSIHRSNQTQLSQLIRQCYHLVTLKTCIDYKEQKEQLARQFDYWLKEQDNEPSPFLELFLEIGFIKLKQDMYFWLVGQNLITITQFDSFFDPLSSPLEQISTLFYLFRVVELWNLIRENLPCLAFENKRELIQNAFKSWKQKMKMNSSVEEAMDWVFIVPPFSDTCQSFLSLVQTGYRKKSYLDLFQQN